MRDFLKVVAFAITLTALIVTFSVALWNEGCNQQAIPHPVQYTGRDDTLKARSTELPMLDQGQNILILPQ